MISVNEYFNGTVKSLGFSTDGEKATVGVMEAGDYEFGTSTVDIMKVTIGSMDVRLPGSAEYRTFKAGESFEVGKGEKFQIKLKTPASYLCLYR
jgi:purine/pyrimidine-nucleoside phosphorylase